LNGDIAFKAIERQRHETIGQLALRTYAERLQKGAMKGLGKGDRNQFDLQNLVGALFISTPNQVQPTTITL
jgi:hypothetical protein